MEESCKMLYTFGKHIVKSLKRKLESVLSAERYSFLIKALLICVFLDSVFFPISTSFFLIFALISLRSPISERYLKPVELSELGLASACIDSSPGTKYLEIHYGSAFLFLMTQYPLAYFEQNPQQ